MGVPRARGLIFLAAAAVLAVGEASTSPDEKGDVEIVSLLWKAGASVDALHEDFGTTLEYAVWVNHRRLWPWFFRMGLAHPRPPEAMPNPSIAGYLYASHRADPYLQRIEAAGGWKRYEQAHRARLVSMLAKVFPRLDADAISHVVDLWAHVGYY